jgi:hypothetical protein
MPKIFFTSRSHFTAQQICWQISVLVPLNLTTTRHPLFGEFISSDDIKAHNKFLSPT